MTVEEHSFTPVILGLLRDEFGDAANEVFERSHLLQYLNIKTRAASRGSKARGSFGNHYAVYVLVEDYVHGDFAESGSYSSYEGARFSDLFRRQRELPFGSKLQNHALNHRLNEEFRRYFPTSEYIPILRDAETNRYWINENLLLVNTTQGTVNIARTVLRLIDAYVDAKRDSFEQFITQVESLQELSNVAPEEVRDFIAALVGPEVDARIFEIASYAILKAFYGRQSVFIGWDMESIEEESLILYKTGRTNANDGGIDFVMKPLGRFFQVTETVDVKKYFLDIDKIMRYPLTFVVKSNDPVESIRERIDAQATRLYIADRIVERLLGSIEEIVNIPLLLERFETVLSEGRLQEVAEELLRQGRMEFHIDEDVSEVEAQEIEVEAEAVDGDEL